MGIYTRDQIQYANMIQNAMQNRARAIEREGDRTAQTGAIWGGAVKDIGNQISDIAMKYGSYQMDTDKMKMQQDFQAEQAALRNKEAMERLAREQQFQAQQNQLNRDNTLAIAQNRFEQAQAEKLASGKNGAKSSLDIYNATIDMIDSELRRTDDPSRIDELKLGRAKMQAKINEIYDNYPDLKPAEPQVQQDNPPAVQETPAGQESQAETHEMMQSEKMAKFSTDLSTSKTSKDTEAALQGLKNINTNMLNNSQKENLQKAIAEGEAKVSQLKKSEESRANVKKNVMGWTNPGDPLPSGWVVRSIAGRKVPMKKVNGVWKTREEVYQ